MCAASKYIQNAAKFETSEKNKRYSDFNSGNNFIIKLIVFIFMQRKA